MSEVNEKEVLLLSVGDEREAEVVRSFLDAQGITALVKHRGSGAYLNIIMGMSSLGIDLLVMQSDLSRAKELINSVNNEVVDENLNPEEEDNFISPNNKIGIIIFLTLVVLLILGYVVNK